MNESDKANATNWYHVLYDPDDPMPFQLRDARSTVIVRSATTLEELGKLFAEQAALDLDLDHQREIAMLKEELAELDERQSVALMRLDELTLKGK